MNNLPVECILLILKNLPGEYNKRILSLVCSQWNELIKEVKDVILFPLIHNRMINNEYIPSFLEMSKRSYDCHVFSTYNKPNKDLVSFLGLDPFEYGLETFPRDESYVLDYYFVSNEWGLLGNIYMERYKNKYGIPTTETKERIFTLELACGNNWDFNEIENMSFRLSEFNDIYSSELMGKALFSGKVDGELIRYLKRDVYHCISFAEMCLFYGCKDLFPYIELDLFSFNVIMKRAGKVKGDFIKSKSNYKDVQEDVQDINFFLSYAELPESFIGDNDEESYTFASSCTSERSSLYDDEEEDDDVEYNWSHSVIDY